MPSSKSKTTRTKPPQGRPVSTSVISQPVVEDTSHHTVLSSFSPNGRQFAFLSLAVDKHRLRVYDTVSGKSVAEHTLDSAGVSMLTWCNVNLSEAQSTSSDTEMSPNKKKRRKRTSLAAEESAQSNTVEVVGLGLFNGTILFFSPPLGRVIRTLSHPTSTAKILSVVVAKSSSGISTIWTSDADGIVRVWDVRKNKVLGSWKTDDRIPYTCLALRPSTEEGRVDMLAAHHGIRLLSALDQTDFDPEKPTQLASFTGHASSIRSLQWDASQSPSTRFFSLADADRFLYIWEVPEGPSKEGRPVASIPLDSNAGSFSLSISHGSPDAHHKQTLLTISASGKISLYPIPLELSLPASSSRTRHKIPTLLPRSNLSVTSKGTSASRVVDAAFSKEQNGSIQIARIVGGVQPVFDVVVSEFFTWSFATRLIVIS